MVNDKVAEVILAVNATVEGQTMRLAHRVPIGGELDYLVEGTLATAIRSRTDF